MASRMMARVQPLYIVFQDPGFLVTRNPCAALVDPDQRRQRGERKLRKPMPADDPDADIAADILALLRAVIGRYEWRGPDGLIDWGAVCGLLTGRPSGLYEEAGQLDPARVRLLSGDRFASAVFYAANGPMGARLVLVPAV